MATRSVTVTAQPTVTLRLSAASPAATDNAAEPPSSRRVQWAENAVDNEFMGKKSSKRCCIFHKQRRAGDHDSDGDDSDNDNSDSDGNRDANSGGSNASGGSGPRDGDADDASPGSQHQHHAGCGHSHAHAHNPRSQDGLSAASADASSAAQLGSPSATTPSADSHPDISRIIGGIPIAKSRKSMQKARPEYVPDAEHCDHCRYLLALRERQAVASAATAPSGGAASGASVGGSGICTEPGPDGHGSAVSRERNGANRSIAGID